MDIWLLIVSIIGGLITLIILLSKALSKNRRILFGTPIHWAKNIWDLLPMLLIFLCFLFISLFFLNKVGISKSECNEKDYLKFKADSLSYILDSLIKQNQVEKISYAKKEEELAKALKSKIQTAYTVKTLEYRVDTIFVVVRDTSNEQRLKEKLNRTQFEKFELSKLIDSLRTQISILEKERK